MICGFCSDVVVLIGVLDAVVGEVIMFGGVVIRMSGTVWKAAERQS